MIKALIYNEWRHLRLTLMLLGSLSLVMWGALYLFYAAAIQRDMVDMIISGMMFFMPVLLSLMLGNSFSREFESQTDRYLLGLPILPGPVYWGKYLTGVTLFMALSTGFFLLFGWINHFAALSFCRTESGPVVLLYFLAGIIIFLLLHAIVFFCTMAGRNSSHNVAAILLLVLLTVVVAPAAALPFIWTERVDATAFALAVLLLGFCLYLTFLCFGYYLWTRYLCCGRSICRPLWLAALTVLLTPSLLYLAAWGITSWRFDRTVADAQRQGYILIPENLVVPLAPGEQDITSQLNRFHSEYKKLSVNIWPNEYSIDGFINSSIPEGIPSTNIKYSPEQLQHMRKLLCHDPDVLKIYTLLQQIAASPQPRCPYVERSEFASFQSLNHAVNLLCAYVLALHQEHRNAEIVVTLRQALTFAGILTREKSWLVAHYSRLDLFMVVTTLIQTADCAPGSLPLYRQALAALDRLDPLAGNYDVIGFTQSWRQQDAQLTEGWITHSFSEGYNIGPPSNTFPNIFLRLLARPRALKILNLLLQQDISRKQYFALGKQYPLYRDFVAAHPMNYNSIGYYAIVKKIKAYRLALALLIYRTEHGAFPDALTALAPAILPDIPVSPFYGVPFSYRRDGNGFVLSSTDTINASRRQFDNFSLRYQPLSETVK